MSTDRTNCCYVVVISAPPEVRGTLRPGRFIRSDSLNTPGLIGGKRKDFHQQFLSSSSFWADLLALGNVGFPDTGLAPVTLP